MAAPHSLIRGKILYTSIAKDRSGEERGREWFTQTRHADGGRVLNAHCELDEPEPAVVRDVILGVDADFRPTDAMVRLVVGDRFYGGGWFRLGPQQAECEAFTALEGRLSQSMLTPGGTPVFGTHPLSGDGWVMASYPVAQGPGSHTVKDMLQSSPDHRGATGPMLYRLDLNLTYLGRESLTVAAGTFEAHHFQLGDTKNALPEEHPPYDIWTTADGDFVFLKGVATGYMMRQWELVEYAKD